MNVLVINSGSSSVKYQVIDTATAAVLHKGLVERVGHSGLTHGDALHQVLALVLADHTVDAGHEATRGAANVHLLGDGEERDTVLAEEGHDRGQMADITREPVEAPDHYRVQATESRQKSLQARALPQGAG